MVFVFQILKVMICKTIFYHTFEKKLSLEKNRKLFFILSFLLWFEAYHKVRFSSENWSACLFIIGFCKYFNQKEKNEFYLLQQKLSNYKSEDSKDDTQLNLLNNLNLKPHGF